MKRALGAQILCSMYVDDHWVDFSRFKKHMPLDLRYMLVCHFPYGPKGPKSFSLLAQFSGFVDNFVSYAAKGQQSL